MGSRHLLEVVVGLLDTLVLVLVAIVKYMMFLLKTGCCAGNASYYQ